MYMYMYIDQSSFKSLNNSSTTAFLILDKCSVSEKFLCLNRNEVRTTVIRSIASINLDKSILWVCMRFNPHLCNNVKQRLDIES